MFCKKCNYILTGNESFCPSCGTAQKKKGAIETEPDTIFTSEGADTESGIFDDDLPLIQQKDTKEKKKKSPSSYILAALIVLTLAAASGIVLADYFEIAPSIDALFSVGADQKESTEASDSPSAYDEQLGTVRPEVTFEASVAYVDSDSDLIMRKGPSSSYAAIGIFPDGTSVQIMGGADDSSFVYVYVPEEDIYGWLDSGFLSSADPDEFQEVTTTQTTTQPSTTEPTEPSTTEAPSEPESTKQTTEAASPDELTVIPIEKYTASITAAQGVNFRKGPGTDYDAITIIGHGEKVTVKGKDKDKPEWFFVVYKEDTEGYIHSSYLQKAE